MKVLHVITGLQQGGAEGVLYRLVAATRNRISHVVVSLGDEGVYGPRMANSGIDVIALKLPRGRLTLGALLRLHSAIRRNNPNVVQTWMYHANLVGGLVARLAGSRKVNWGIRHSTLDARSTKRRTRWVAYIGALLSAYVPSRIVSCSERARQLHVDLGYAADKFTVINNGYDLRLFAPDSAARSSLRRQFGIGATDHLIGMVARWDAQKDHANLLAAMSKVWKARPTVKLLCAGTGISRGNSALWRLVQAAHGEDRTMLLGPRDDVAQLMNALDLHVLSSYGEAFPNTVAEAMACGTPCVVTDVGDAAFIVGDTGRVVPPCNSELLAMAILSALEDQDKLAERDIRLACRTRIQNNFSLDKMADAFLTLWEKTATG